MLTTFTSQNGAGVLIILGTLPKVTTAAVAHPTMVYLNSKLYQTFSLVTGRPEANRFTPLMQDNVDISVHPFFLYGLKQGPHIRDAYAAALSARFEHGERG